MYAVDVDASNIIIDIAIIIPFVLVILSFFSDVLPAFVLSLSSPMFHHGSYHSMFQ